MAFGFGVGIQRLGSIGVALRSELIEMTPPTGVRPTGFVFGDPVAANNGTYAWNGTVWTKVRNLPDSLAVMTDIAGTANAITGSLPPFVSPASVAMVILVPVEANTGAVTLNGNPVLDAAGNPLAPGALAAGRSYLLQVGSSSYRVLLNNLGMISDISGLQSALDTLQTNINSKADASTTTSALATKADAAAMVSALATKADAAATIAALAGKLATDGSNGDAAFLSRLKWLSKGIGEFYVADDGATGVDIPPSNPTLGLGVWVELTAGLRGTGQFNNGKLSSESVSGSAPLVLATAVVSVAGSPMNGATIRLLNTERRGLRPGAPGTLEADAAQDWEGTMSFARFNGGANIVRDRTGAVTANGTNGSAESAFPNTGSGVPYQEKIDPKSAGVRTANETRIKSIGARVFRRVG